jgi:hypothetical protein
VWSQPSLQTTRTKASVRNLGKLMKLQHLLAVATVKEQCHPGTDMFLNLIVDFIIPILLLF